MDSVSNMFEEQFEPFQDSQYLIGKYLKKLEARKELLSDAIMKDGEYVDPIAIEMVNDAYYYADLMETHHANVQTFVPPEHGDNVIFRFNRK